MSEEVGRFLILVVDDERMIASTTSQILQGAGFETVAFNDPRLLLAFCEEAAPDLIISDIIMPELDGFELTEQVRKKHPDCRVILFTGQAGVEDLREMSIEQGLNLEVLSKPVAPTKLIKMVRNLAVAEIGPLPASHPNN